VADEVKDDITFTDDQRLAVGNIAELVKEFFRKYVPMGSFERAKEDMAKIITEANKMGGDLMFEEIIKQSKAKKK
jgi:hypothetical protein